MARHQWSEKEERYIKSLLKGNKRGKLANILKIIDALKKKFKKYKNAYTYDAVATFVSRSKRKKLSPRFYTN
ncbi:hypothetical protein EPN87_03950 [archaeon]|nr:MAG: hypothetical protein EPN87_03950 [archaeon]